MTAPTSPAHTALDPHEPTDTRSVVLERDLPFPPEKVWRTLTETPLLDQWLMESDFAPQVGRRFRFTAEWGTVAGEVLSVEPNTRLSYTWNAMGLDSVVTWTLTPGGNGTHLRLKHAGFRPDQNQAYQGATYGWQKFLVQLEQVTAKL